MAYIDMSRTGEIHEKKVTNHMVLDVFPGMANPPVAAGNFLIGYLPKDSHITGAYVFTTAVSDAGSINIGTTEGGTEILDLGDTASVGPTGSLTGVTDTGTGVPVYITTGGAYSQGSFQVVVTYIEYRKNNGELTKIT